MTGEPTLTERIHERFGTLPAKQQAVARILADDPSSVALSSVSELAQRAGVDAATVVRTCQSLGYSGWRELLADVRGGITRQRTFAERVAALGSQDGDLTAMIHENARRNVDATFESLADASLEQVARLVSEAGMAVIVAGGASKGAGEYLTSSLQIIGVRSCLVSGISDAAPVLATLAAQDVVIGISLWRYLTSTVQILEYAKREVGTPTVVLTDSAVSRATEFADQVLVAATSTVGPRLSMTGVIALSEAIVAHTALVNPRRSQAAASRASALYFDGHVTGDPAAPHGGEAGRFSWENRLAGEVDRG